MNTTQLLREPAMATLKKFPRQASLLPAQLDAASFPPRFDHKPIQWPTEQEIRQVSKTLAEITRTGRLREATGDYFNSGDLAYQMREIMRDTLALFKRTQRLM